MDSKSSPNLAATSTGHALSESSYLDARFLAAQAEYEAMLRWIEVQPAWHVLDAGAGNGSYLPLLCELVGDLGGVTAVDLAPENILACEQRLRDVKPACPVETKVGSVLQLPFGAAQFDAVWFANTSQYLNDAELATALSELVRVTKRGGLVAIKEADATCIQVGPIAPAVMWRSLDAMRRHDRQMAGILRAIDLPRWARQAGLKDIRVKTTVIERQWPLRPVEQTALGSLVAFFAEAALNAGLSEQDRQEWQKLQRAVQERRLLDQADFYFREGAVVVVGVVP